MKIKINDKEKRRIIDGCKKQGDTYRFPKVRKRTKKKRSS